MIKQSSKVSSNDTSAHQAINIIGEGTSIKGDVVANNDIRIDGELNGTLDAKGRVVVGEKGKIEGTIKCKNIEISGFIKGKINIAELLSMKSTAKIEGDIVAGKLSIEPGAVFTGSCSMGGNTIINNGKGEAK